MKNNLYEFTVTYKDGHTWDCVACSKREVMDYLKNAFKVDKSKIAKITGKKLNYLEEVE